MKRAARFADVWHPFRLPPEDVKALVPGLKESLVEAGRDKAMLPIAPKVPLVISSEKGPLPTQGPLSSVLDALRRYQDAGATEFCFDILPEDADNACNMIDLITDEISPALG